VPLGVARAHSSRTEESLLKTSSNHILTPPSPSSSFDTPNPRPHLLPYPSTPHTSPNTGGLPPLLLSKEKKSHAHVTGITTTAPHTHKTQKQNKKTTQKQRKLTPPGVGEGGKDWYPPHLHVLTTHAPQAVGVREVGARASPPLGECRACVSNHTYLSCTPHSQSHSSVVRGGWKQRSAPLGC